MCAKHTAVPQKAKADGYGGHRAESDKYAPRAQWGDYYHGGAEAAQVAATALPCFKSKMHKHLWVQRVMPGTHHPMRAGCVWLARLVYTKPCESSIITIEGVPVRALTTSPPTYTRAWDTAAVAAAGEASSSCEGSSGSSNKAGACAVRS